uniref:Uncharacterized protein n=1 Tax=Quercus lobata TaxID=97700 RepID=A0A7N2LVD4_QUELO
MRTLPPLRGATPGAIDSGEGERSRVVGEEAERLGVLKVNLVLDMLWNFAFIRVGLVVLGLSMEERPIAPLRKIGFDKDTPVYLTESSWQSSLDALKDLFLKTYTKNIAGKVIDFYVCSQSDIFVPAISGLFYSNVVGKRIAASRIQTLDPANLRGSSASASNFITP